MEELKVQNSLLLQLINSKNRQNQILFQQYDQLAADNRQLQAHADQLRTQNSELKRQTPPPHHPHPHDSPPRPSPFDQEIAELKKRNAELQASINDLKSQLEERGGTIILLQDELQKAKLVSQGGEETGKAKEEALQAREMLRLKEQAVGELTEYMQVQSEKISELTKAGIIAIENYQAKIAEKDTLCQQLTQKIAQLSQKIGQLTVEQVQESTPERVQVGVEVEKVKELQTIILSKEQSIAELSEFLQAQSDKVSRLENTLSESNLQALQGEIDNLKQIVESKEQSILELSEFLNTISLRNKDMEERMQGLEEKPVEIPQIEDKDVVADLQSKIQKLNQQIVSQDEKLSQLSNKLQESESPLLREVEILRARLSTKEDEVQLLTGKLEEREGQLSELRVQFDEKVVKITMLESISEQNDAEFPFDRQLPPQSPAESIPEVEVMEQVDYEGLLQLKSNEIETLRATIEQKDQSLRDFTEFISQQTDRISALERQVSEFQAIIKAKDQSIDELRTFLQQSYAKNAEIDSKYQQGEENVVKLKQQLEELKGRNAEKPNEQIAEQRINIILSETEQAQDVSPRQKSILSSLQDRIKQLQSQVASKSQTIAELSEFMNTQADSLRAYKQQEEQSLSSSKIAELEAIIKMKEQSNSELSSFLQEAYAKTAEMDLTLTESQRDMLTVQEQLLALRALQNGKGLDENENTEKVATVSETMQDLKNIIAEKQYKINELKRSNEQLTVKISTPQLSLVEEELRKQIQSLESTLASKEDTIGELTDFMNQQAQELERLTDKLEALNSVPKDSYSVTEGESELRVQISELELTLKSKNENFNELTDFMSQQAEELEELRARVGEGSGGQAFNKQTQSHLLEKIGTLQEIIKAKEMSQAETSQFLQEAYSKIATLQEQKIEFARKEAEIMEKLNEQQKIVNQLRVSHQQLITTLTSAQETMKNLQLKQEQNANIIVKLEEQLRERPKETVATGGEDIQALKSTIQDLQDVINTKSQTIAQLSQFMNEQSLRVEELEEQLNGPQNGNNNNSERVEELEAIIRSKQVSIAELTQFLEEAYAKSAELQQSLSAMPQQAPLDVQVAKEDGNIESQLQKGKEQALYKLEADVNERKAVLEQINSEIQHKNAQISEMAAFLEQTSKLLVQQQQKLNSIKSEAQQAQAQYNAQVDEYNQHRESMDTELGNVAQALEEQVNHMETQQKELEKLQEEADQLRSQITRLREGRNEEKVQGQAQQSQKGPVNNNVVAELQAKVTEYEGFLNDREEQMAAMMQVMENLQAEISNKNELIDHLQEGSAQASPSDPAKIQQLEEEIRNLKQTIQELQGVQSSQRRQVRLEGQYKRMEVEQQLREESQKLRERYKQQLGDMKFEEDELERELNLEGNFNNDDEVENNQQLTVLQVIEQILVYSEEEVDMGSVLRMIEVLKRSYLKENESILKENSELKDTLNNILEINNSLVEEIEKLKVEREQQSEVVQRMDRLLQEGKERESRLEINYQQEIKQLRRSISGLKEESPIERKQGREDEMNTISKLEDEVVALRQENQQKEVELAQIKANSNKKFVNELNNLLDSCTVAKDGQELREMEEELERVTAERDEIAAKCKDFENQVANLQRQCIELTTSLQNINKNQPPSEPIQHTQGQDSLHTAELLAGLEQPTHQRRPSELEEVSADKWQAYNEELQGLLQEKNAAINQLQETMLGLEKGYNSEIMNLRKNIAELKNESIALRKSLYQANPNGVDINELIKETFQHDERDTDFFRPAYPTYTHSLLLAQPHNASYYSDAHHPRPPHYQRYFPPSLQLNLGEKFMGRRCRQASPFSYGDASRATAWEPEYQRY